jgi:hypothetical protein
MRGKGQMFLQKEQIWIQFRCLVDKADTPRIADDILQAFSQKLALDIDDCASILALGIESSPHVKQVLIVLGVHSHLSSVLQLECIPTVVPD